MPTECIPDLFGFEPVEGREVVAAFDAGMITSDAGALLLRATDRAIKMMERFASCFHDVRRPELIEHEVATLVGQRVFGIALGYEDLNDHDELRHDPMMAVLAGKLRRASVDGAAGSVEEVARIVAHIRRQWPRVRILVRADSGFAREELMAWCEANGVDFLFGLAKNDRRNAMIKNELEQAAATSQRTGKPARRFKQFMWTTRGSWSRRRRVVAKAEWTQGEANPRCVVTSLAREECKARYLYEKIYCARGDMENRIKECQLDLYADRTSTASMRANQLRLWFASMAYVLLCALRRIGLHDTEYAKATCGTIRLKLLKIGALVRISVRRIKVAMASGCPAAAAWGLAAVRLAASANPRASPA